MGGKRGFGLGLSPDGRGRGLVRIFLFLSQQFWWILWLWSCGWELSVASLLRICTPVYDVDCWEWYSWCSRELLLFDPWFWDFIWWGQQSAIAKRSAAQLPSAPLTPHHPKSKKTKKNPHQSATPRPTGQRPDPDPRSKKIKSHPNNSKYSTNC